MIIQNDNVTSVFNAPACNWKMRIVTAVGPPPSTATSSRHLLQVKLPTCNALLNLMTIWLYTYMIIFRLYTYFVCICANIPQSPCPHGSYTSELQQFAPHFKCMSVQHVCMSIIVYVSLFLLIYPCLNFCVFAPLLESIYDRLYACMYGWMGGCIHVR